jgi:hypothetical protein
LVKAAESSIGTGRYVYTVTTLQLIRYADEFGRRQVEHLLRSKAAYLGGIGVLAEIFGIGAIGLGQCQQGPAAAYGQ